MPSCHNFKDILIKKIFSTILAHPEVLILAPKESTQIVMEAPQSQDKVKITTNLKQDKL